MNRATRILNFDFKIVNVKDASGECVIEGYANTNSKDRVGDIVMPEAFAKSLPTYQKNPVILLNHDWNDVIGRCTHTEITDKGLFIRARISDTRNDIKTLIREGCYSTFSIGYNELDADYDESTKTKYVKELELLEISVVSVPANTEAMFTQIEAKTETEEADKKDESKAKTAGDLKAFISIVKSVVGSELDEGSLFAVIDYFNSNEETMTKEQLIAALKAKTLPAATEPKKDDAKADEAKPGEEQKPGDDLLKAIAAKLDALAEAMVQVMEKLDKAPASEEKPKDEEEAKEEKPEDKPKEDEAKEEDEEKAKDEECEDKEKDDEEEKEMNLDEVNTHIADLTSQIQKLDEELNG